jgi:hypothetical protein
MVSSQNLSRRDDLLLMLLHGGAASNAIATHVVDAFTYETVQRVQLALLSTTDGTEVDDNVEIPAGEIRRILADLRAGGAR